MIDGDTIQVTINGKVQKVRMIGVDTPESVDPRKPVQCFAKEAAARTKQLLLNKSVSLAADKTQGDKDIYGRLLRYVILNTTNINKQLINEGYAHEYTYVFPYTYQTVFRQAQKAARGAQRGLWSPKTCSGKSTVTITTKPTVSTTQPAVKKSVNNFCHAKGSTYYNQTKQFTPYSDIKKCLASGGKLPG